jgi:pimeloyl-ACP methyl ester carboxylesterase
MTRLVPERVGSEFGNRSAAKIVLIAALIVVIALAGALFFGQRSVLYPAPRPPRAPGPQLGELIRLPSTVATWSPPASRDGVVIVHFHGNGEQLATLEPIVSGMRARGLGVLAVEYPGYGLAGGSPSRRSILAAGTEAIDFAADRLGISRERLIIQGQSLGSGVAAQLASGDRARKLVLISPFTSVGDLAAHLFVAPVRYLVRDRFDTRAVAPSVHVPVLIIHGTNDELVPFTMGEELARLFPNARLLPIVGGRHNDLWSRHERVVASSIAEFVATQN